jgi:uncharacterized protein involved in outer membrane biogenesis
MRLKRPAVYVPAAIAILALAAFAFAWLGARTPVARRMAADAVADATGLPATIGSMRLALLPRPAVEIRGLAIAQPEGFGAAPLAEIGRARIAIPWSSLFGGSAIDSVAVSEPVLRPALAADGSDNWSGVIARLAELGGEGEPDWSVGRIEIDQGALEFSDAATGSSWRLTAVTIGAERIAPAAEFPLTLSLAAVAGESTFHFALEAQARTDPAGGRHDARDVRFRGWAGGEWLPLAGVEWLGTLAEASYEDASGAVTARGGSFNVAGIPGEFSGTLDLDEPELQAAFAIKTDSFAPRAPAIVFGNPLPATADPQAFGNLQLSVEGRLQGGRLELDPISGRLDDTGFDGRAVPGERLVRLVIDRIDVDRYLAPEQKTRQEKKATLEALVAELGRFDIDAEIRVQEARVAGARLRDTVIRVERGDEAAP